MTPREVSATLPPPEVVRLSLAERRAAFERRRRRRWLRVWSVVGVLGVVAGSVWGVVDVRARAAHEAASRPVRWEARAGDPAIPAVVWPQGVPEHGEWADDPWVQALRELHLVNAVAFNSGRVEGRADLLLLATRERVDNLQGYLGGGRMQGSLGGLVPVYPGPRPFEVLDVVPHEGGDGADVLVCTIVGLSWHEDDVPEEVMGDTAGRRKIWEMVRGEDGHIRNAGIQSGDFSGQPQDCTISDVHYGLFDPQPVRLAELPTSDETEPAEVDSGLGLEDVESREDREEYLDGLMREYDELRELAEQAARG